MLSKSWLKQRDVVMGVWSIFLKKTLRKSNASERLSTRLNISVRYMH